MLRAALATARRGPRLSRLLSAAATSAVPAPNQQPEVFCNQVSLEVASAGPWAGRDGRPGLSFPARRSLRQPTPAQVATPWPGPARPGPGESWAYLSPMDAAAVGIEEPGCAPRARGPTQKAHRSQPLSARPHLHPYWIYADPGPEFRRRSWVRTPLWQLLPNPDFV